jgi:hypothetical protein
MKIPGGRDPFLHGNSEDRQLFLNLWWNALMSSQALPVWDWFTLQNFINFVMKQLSLRVDRAVYSVWLADQLQLHENEILVEIISYALKMMFGCFSYTRVLCSIIFSMKNTFWTQIIYIIKNNNIHHLYLYLCNSLKRLLLTCNYVTSSTNQYMPHQHPSNIICHVILDSEKI